MIRTESEYKAAQKQLAQATKVLDEQLQKYRTEGFTEEQAQRLIAPSLTYARQCQEELAFYEQLLRGEMPSTETLSSIGQMLVALRIVSGITQRELASRLAVSEAVVSRDEKNEYHGVTMQKAQRIVDALQGRVQVQWSPARMSPVQASPQGYAVPVASQPFYSPVQAAFSEVAGAQVSQADAYIVAVSTPSARKKRDR